MENRMESLRQNWFVIQQLIKRDKQRSLSSTFMGELWEIINPLINMIVMVLVFGKMFGGNDFNVRGPQFRIDAHAAQRLAAVCFGYAG